MYHGAHCRRGALYMSVGRGHGGASRLRDRPIADSDRNRTGGRANTAHLTACRYPNGYPAAQPYIYTYIYTHIYIHTCTYTYIYVDSDPDRQANVDADRDAYPPALRRVQT